MKNTICLDPKVYRNQAQRSEKPQQTTNWWSSTDLSLQSLEELPPQTFKYEEHSKQNHPNYLPRSQSSLESSPKASRNLNKSQISEAQRIQASKALKNFHHKPSKMKNTRRTWRTKDFQQAHSQRFIVILFQRNSIHSSTKLKYIGCSNQNHKTTNPINKTFKEIKSEDNSFVIIENCTTHSSTQIRICETILLVWFISNRGI